MVITASVRTDIPAFYSEWFIKQIHQGYVHVPNPFYPGKIKHISLRKEDVDAIIFWTKNPIPMMEYLDELLKEYKIGFQITITGYGLDIEPKLPNKRQIIEAVKDLAKKIGKEKIIVRYDPIFLNEKYTIDYHIKMFDKLMRELSSYVSNVVISFVDIYKNTLKHASMYHIHEMAEEEIHHISRAFGEICRGYQLYIQTCAEKYDLSQYGIQSSSCLTNEYLEAITGNIALYKKQKKRKNCDCIETVDIGVYNSCLHFCRYCYANYDEKSVIHNYNKIKSREG